MERAWKERHRLDEAQQAEVERLRSNSEPLQRRRYLEGFRIESAHIAGIGPGRLATLASFGIETAADLSRESLQEVPGMPGDRVDALLEWRAAREAGFRFRPRQAATVEELAAVADAFDARRRTLELALLDGVRQLEEILQNARARERAQAL
jgi:DNA-binding helix-hairpin-helix protein with protein kinase domain